MLEEQLQNLIFFLQAKPIIAAAIGAVILILFYLIPKGMFKIAAFCLFIVIVFYFIGLFSGAVNTGSKQKDQMIYKTREALGE